jgi:hypothetical protein
MFNILFMMYHFCAVTVRFRTALCNMKIKRIVTLYDWYA